MSICQNSQQPALGTNCKQFREREQAPHGASQFAYSPDHGVPMLQQCPPYTERFPNRKAQSFIKIKAALQFHRNNMNGQLQISTTTPSQKGRQKTSCTRDYLGGSYSKHHQQKIMSKTKLGLHYLRLVFPNNNYICRFCCKATIITTNTCIICSCMNIIQFFPLEFGGTLHTIIFVLLSLAF